MAVEPEPSAAGAFPLEHLGARTTHPLLLDAILASAMDAIVAIDEAQRVVLFNPAAGALFGYTAAEIVGEPLDRLLPEHFRFPHRDDVAEFITTGETARAMGHLRPLSALRRSGEEFPIEATISQISISGRTYGAAIVRDISARQAAEAALKRQANLLDLSTDAIFTWDWYGAITSWNRGAERLYGYTSEDAIGQISHRFLATRHPTSLQAFLSELERTGTWEGELVHTRADGSEVAVESRHVLVDDGGHRYVLEATRDISARKRAESERAAVLAREAAARAEATAMEAERDRLRQILDGLPSGVQIVRAPDAAVVFANATLTAWILGPDAAAGAEVAYGRDFQFVRADGVPLAADDRPGVRALRGESVVGQQLLLEGGDGRRFPVSAHASPVRDNRGGVRDAIVVIQDVTNVREAEQLKDDFLALISHELRTPLTAIHGGAHLLASAAAALDADARNELLLDVVTESERLDRMLANILMLANVLGGRLRVDTEPVLIGPLVRRVVAHVDRHATTHDFVVALAADLPPVEADQDLLEEVLRNLFENARKYAPDGGVIRTTADHQGERVTIRITDEGIGLAPEHAATVFERFRRVGGDPSVRGMGLGLYLSRHLVEAQGGRIEAQSPGVGRGTTFTVVLPVAAGWAPEYDSADNEAAAAG